MNIEQIETPQLQAAIQDAEFWIKELGPRTRRNQEKIKKILVERYLSINNNVIIIILERLICRRSAINRFMASLKKCHLLRIPTSKNFFKTRSHLLILIAYLTRSSNQGKNILYI